MKFVIRHLRHLLPLEGQESVWLPMATGLSHRAQRSPQKQVSASRFVSNNIWQSMPTLVAQAMRRLDLRLVSHASHRRSPYCGTAAATDGVRCVFLRPRRRRNNLKAAGLVALGYIESWVATEAIGSLSTAVNHDGLTQLAC